MMKLIGFLKKLNRERNYKTKEFKRKVKLYTMARLIDDKYMQSINFHSVNRVLFPFVDLGIGDAVCHTGLWHQLKSAGYIVQVIVEERNRPLFERIEYIDEVYVVDLNKINDMGRIETDLIVSLYSWMKRKEVFNVAILKNIKYKYAISVGGWIRKPYNLIIPVRQKFHITSAQREILDFMGAGVEELSYRLSVPLENELFLSSYLDDFKDKNIVVINPFASVDERSFNLEELSVLVEKVASQRGVHVFIIGEGRKIEPLNKHIKKDNVSICIFNSLWDAIALIKKADLVVSVDTAIVHIACAFDKKLIAVYFSMLLDHNKEYEGNTIFSPLSRNAKQLIFDKKVHKLDLDLVCSETINALACDGD